MKFANVEPTGDNNEYTKQDAFEMFVCKRLDCLFSRCKCGGALVKWPFKLFKAV